jgi:predicted DCC family thiol-disulfide oxidoreductase YuxK
VWHGPFFILCYTVAMTNDWEFKLLYDGECPMCRREIDWLKRRNRAGRLAFEDIAAPDFDPGRYGLTQSQVMGVMHGVYPDGRIVTRLDAFRQAYQLIGLGWVMAPTRWPGFRWLAARGYEWFARNRVAIGRFFGARPACETGRCATPAASQMSKK